MSQSYFSDFNPCDRESLRAAYREGDLQGRDRFSQLWVLADLNRAHGVRDIKEAATQAALEIYK
jgi:hypothetical protein